MMIDQAFERECEELLSYLYELAARKYGDCNDPDSLIQDTILAYVKKKNQGETVEHPKGFLAAVMKNKYNEQLRRRYRHQTVSFESFDLYNDATLESLGTDGESDDEERDEEYARVRREIGRLIKIYREVTVRHYMHGHSVERIADELGISQGTVKSRLSSARNQIKEGIVKMEKYSSLSYEPKKISIGIWGGDSIRSEPFTLLHSLIEGNILYLAYEKPIAIREIADTLGMPAAFLEPLVDKLVDGELMGRTEGGLVYTRCYMCSCRERLGDVDRQEKLAEKYAENIWQIFWKHIQPLTEREQFAAMSEKQKATMILFAIDHCLTQVILRTKPTPPPNWSEYPERPNGGKWWAILKVYDEANEIIDKYNRSGPVRCGGSKNGDGNFDYVMRDLQSVFGGAHWCYADMKYKVSLQNVGSFYASLLGCDTKVEGYMTELIPEFERLHILRRRDDGEIVLDIPALTFDEARVWNEAMKKIREKLVSLMGEELASVWLSWTHKIPKHVDGREHFLHYGALASFSTAVMLAISEKNLIPYDFEVGKTPIIFLEYRKNQ